MDQAQKLLDFSQPLDVALLDQAVVAFYQNGNVEVQKILVPFQNHPEAWTRVKQIIEQSKVAYTVQLALGILERTVRYRWLQLPPPHRQSVRNFVVDRVIQLSLSQKSLEQNAGVLKKFNLVLVQIVKHEWPQNWPSFIPDLVNSSKKQESLCANNMQILLLLSEEIFDYSAGQMTQDKIKQMKQSLHDEFRHIYQLCEFVLDRSKDQTLLQVTLQCLLRYLHWIPIGFIFETDLAKRLVTRFFPLKNFQNITLKCLAEIASINPQQHRQAISQQQYRQYEVVLVQMFAKVIETVNGLLTRDTVIAEAYMKGGTGVHDFVRHLSIFITSFLKNHLNLVEKEASQPLGSALNLLLRISEVDDVDIFNICLEYWNILVADLFNTHPQQRSMDGMGLGGGMSDRVRLYASILSQLRQVIISKMAKPEEVLIVEDSNGEVVRELLKDTDSIALYKSMRECLIYLTHLDPNDTQQIMRAKLARQVDGSNYSWHNLNTLCWAIGSISGALLQNQEQNFLVHVIKDLLFLCEIRRGKDHKAVIASNIMYVVGQYPRFLKEHRRFLKAVILKLFEFMHEKHPGVQDMSCDTFLKIARRCKRRLVAPQNGDRPFVNDIVEQIEDTIRDLQPSQIHTFYKAMGEIVAVESDPQVQQHLLQQLMMLPNKSWSSLIAQVSHNQEALHNPKAMEQFVHLLRTNNRVAGALGSPYMVQLSKIFMDALGLYKSYSEIVSQRLKGADVDVLVRTHIIRSMRSIKREVLLLIQTFIECCKPADYPNIFKNIVPALMEPVLRDYQLSTPASREPEVLSLLATIVSRIGQPMAAGVPKIFESVFQSTVDMITQRYEYPEHRIQFFKLIEAIAETCFEALLKLTPIQFDLIMKAIVWAMKHLERDVSETGLTALMTIIINVEKMNVANDFHKRYFISMVRNTLDVMTDTFHKPGFRHQAQILAKLFQLVDRGHIGVPLWGPNENFPDNQTYVRHVMVDTLRKSFPNVAAPVSGQFVEGLFRLNTQDDQFKNHLRDFLVRTKEFSEGKDLQEMYGDIHQRQRDEAAAREQARLDAVPGLRYVGPQQDGILQEHQVMAQARSQPGDAHR